MMQLQKPVLLYHIKSFKIQKEKYKLVPVLFLLLAVNGMINNKKKQNCKIIFCRSLVANLGAANHFTIDHLDDPKNQEYVNKSKIIYTAVCCDN